MPKNPTEQALLERPYRFYFRKHWKLAVAGLTCLLLTNSFEVSVPWLIGRALDQLANNKGTPAIVGTVEMLLIVIFFLSIFRFFWRIFWGKFHHTVADDLRNRVFDKLTELTPSFFRQRKTGQLMSLISYDVNSFRIGIGPGMLILCDGIFLSALILPMMISISWSWTWKTLALMPFVPFVVHTIISRIHDAYHDRQNRFADLSGAAQETVSGIRVIKSFAQEDQQTGQFNQHSRAFQKASDRVAAWDAIFGPALELPVALGSVVLLLAGSNEVIQGAVTLGAFFAFYQYIQRMIWPMSAMGISISRIQESRASFQRIREVLETVPDIEDTGTVEVDQFESLEVKDLWFRYPGADEWALKGVSFRLTRGQTLGVIGATGSGKTTLVEILSRQYPFEKGHILLNGHPLESIRLSSLRKVMALVPQEAFLFSRKVSENVAFARDIWELNEVKEAASTVSLDQEIESWPKAYDALVGERGVNLSGGQKQRMTLARAIMKTGELVVLDDSLSAIDGRTEKAILSELKSELRKTTAIVVSHRLSSISWADQILVLDEGRTEALGRHTDLLHSSKTYRRLFEIQTEAPA